MRKLNRIALCGVLMLGNTLSLAQNAPPGRGERGAPPDARDGHVPPVPPEQRMLQQLSTLMGSDEAGWAVIRPRIEEIQLLIKQRERFTKPKAPPPPRPPARDGEPPRPEPELRDPNLIVDLGPDPNKDTPSRTAAVLATQHYVHLAKLASYPTTGQGEPGTSLAAFRAARAKSDQELATAREQLRGLLTTRQEVILVVMGILD